LDYLDLHFTARTPDERRELPPFLGPTLRGAFGFLLKRTVCQVSHGLCDRCLLVSACPYPAVFEGIPSADRELMRKYQRVPQPFVLRTPFRQELDPTEQRLEWCFRLFGGAIRYWPYVVHVFQTACESGLGRRQVKPLDMTVTDGSGQVLIPAEPDAMPEPRSHQIPDSAALIPPRCTLRWKFESPVQIVQGGKAAGTRLDGLDLMLAARRRCEVMSAFYGATRAPQAGATDEAAEDTSLLRRFDRSEFTTVENTLKHFEMTRYSGRQERKVELHGVAGDLVIEGPWGEVGGWLAAAPYLHVGKSVTFGFGCVSWEIV